MAGLAWLGTLLLLPTAGAPVLARHAFRRFPPAARVVLATGVGAALVSFTMTLFALAAVPWSTGPIAVTAALIAWALSALVRGEAAPPAPDRLGRAGALAAALSVASTLAAFAATFAGAATSLDLFFFWGPKAQQFAVARGVDAAFLAEPLHQYLHAYYPPLVASLDALATMVAGRFSWSAAILTFPILLGALAAALPGVLSGAASRPAAAAASALAVGSLAVVGIRANIAGNGDMPLLFFETLAMALLIRRDASEPAVQLLAGILLAGGAAAKVEGLPFALAAAALFLLATGAGAAESARSAARLLLPSAVALAAWFAFGLTRHLFHAYSEYGSFFVVHFEHLPRAASAAARVLAGTGRGLPYLVPLLGTLAAGRPRRASLVPLGTAAALAAFLLFTYLHLENDPSDWIEWSAARVFMPVAMLLALAPCAAEGEPEAQDPRAP